MRYRAAAFPWLTATLLAIALGLCPPAGSAEIQKDPPPLPDWWEDIEPAPSPDLLSLREWRVAGPFPPFADPPGEDVGSEPEKHPLPTEEGIDWRNLRLDMFHRAAIRPDRMLRAKDPGSLLLRTSWEDPANRTLVLGIEGPDVVACWIDGEEVAPDEKGRYRIRPRETADDGHELVLRCGGKERFPRRLELSFEMAELRGAVKAAEAAGLPPPRPDLIGAYLRLGEVRWAVWHLRRGLRAGDGGDEAGTTLPSFRALLAGEGDREEALGHDYFREILAADRAFMDAADVCFFQDRIIRGLERKEEREPLIAFLEDELGRGPGGERASSFLAIIARERLAAEEPAPAGAALARYLARSPGPERDRVEMVCRLSQLHLEREDYATGLAFAFLAYACAKDGHALQRAGGQVLTALKARDGDFEVARAWMAFIEAPWSPEPSEADVPFPRSLAEIELPATWRETLTAPVAENGSPTTDGLRRLWAGDARGGLELLDHAWRTCRIDERALRARAADLAVALKARYGHPGAGLAFYRFQKWGPAGEDGEVGTDDDLADPVTGGLE